MGEECTEQGFWKELEQELGLQLDGDSGLGQVRDAGVSCQQDPAELFAVKFSEFDEHSRIVRQKSLKPTKIEVNEPVPVRSKDHLQAEVFSVVKDVSRVLSEFPGKLDSKGAHLKSFFKLGTCQECKRKQFIFQSYSYFSPASNNTETNGICSECLETVYGEKIHEILSSRTHWQTPFARGLAGKASATDITIQAALDFNNSQFRLLSDKSIQVHPSTGERALSLHSIHMNLQHLLQLREKALFKELASRQAFRNDRPEEPDQQTEKPDGTTANDNPVSFLKTIYAKLSEIRNRNQLAEEESECPEQEAESVQQAEAADGSEDSRAGETIGSLGKREPRK